MTPAARRLVDKILAIGAALDVDQTLGVPVRYLGEDDGRVVRLRELSVSGG